MALTEEARRLEKALFQSGNNNELIVDLLTSLDLDQRLTLVSTYNKLFKRELINDFHEELGGLFEDACIILIKPYSELNADMVHQALVGDKFTLLPIIDVFFTQTKPQLDQVREEFNKKYGGDVNDFLVNIPDANLLQITSKILNTQRESRDHVDLYLAYEEVDQLNEAGLGLSWTRQNELLDLLCTRSFGQLRLTLQIYEKVTGNFLQDDIRRYFDGDLHDIFSSIVSAIQNSTDYFAERLHDCLKGGRNDQTIINILVARSEIDLNNIEHRYKSIFWKKLKDEIRISMKGDFRQLLLALLRGCHNNDN